MPIRRPAATLATTLATTLALAALPLRAQPASGPAAFEGRWITESGNLEVEIARCGPAWCGTVSRVLGNRSMSMSGREMNPADARPALGMTILSGLTPAGDPTSLHGEIYNRENAKTYSVRLALDSPQQMAVRAYLGLPLFGKTQVWQRAAEQ